MNDGSASVSVVPGATWLALAMVAEGVETGSVASTEQVPMRGRREAREPGAKRERRGLLRNRHGRWQPKKEYEVANELLRAGEDAGRSTYKSWTKSTRGETKELSIYRF